MWFLRATQNEQTNKQTEARVLREFRSFRSVLPPNVARLRCAFAETEDSDSRGGGRRRNAASTATATTAEDSEGHVSLQTDDEREEHFSSSNDNETTDISG